MTPEPADPTDEPAYQAWLESLLPDCRCTFGPCGGLMAGGCCDEITYDDDYWADLPDLSDEPDDPSP